MVLTLVYFKVFVDGSKVIAKKEINLLRSESGGSGISLQIGDIPGQEFGDVAWGEHWSFVLIVIKHIIPNYYPLYSYYHQASFNFFIFSVSSGNALNKSASNP